MSFLKRDEIGDRSPFCPAAIGVIGAIGADRRCKCVGYKPDDEDFLEHIRKPSAAYRSA
jgi:hypothetical protein